MTDNRTLEKRRIRLRNAKAQLENVGRILDNHEDDAPPDDVKNLKIAREAMEAAEDGINGDDGERLVHVATSAATKVGDGSTLIGVSVRIGGRKGKRLANFYDLFFDRHEVAKKWLKNNPDRSHGWKSKLARHLAKTFQITKAAAYKFIQRHNLK